MKRILGYLKPLLGRMLTGFGIKLAGTVMDLAIPWILAHIIDEVVPTGDRRAIFLWGAGMALCAVIALAGNVIANRRPPPCPGTRLDASVTTCLKKSSTCPPGRWTS